MYKSLARVRIWGSKVKGHGHQGQKRQSAAFFSGAVLGGTILGAQSGDLRAVYVWENIFSIAGVAGVAMGHAMSVTKYVMQLCHPSVLRRWENQRMLSSVF